MKALRLALTFVALLAAAACTSGSPSSPSSPPLNGSWRITAMTPAGANVSLFLPPEITYSITFETLRASMRINCNTCIGSYTSSGSEVTIGPILACTRVACVAPASESLDNDLLKILGGTHTVAQSSSGVTLSSSRGSVGLIRQ